MNTPDPSIMREALRGNDIGDAMDLLVERALGDCSSSTVATQAPPRAGSRLGHSVSVNYRKERE
jgi:hypothetical protein